jgi:hypothetical protein
MGEPKLVDTAAAGRELHELGKHRTEVTEVTEGIGADRRTKVRGHRGCWARTARIGKSIAQRSRRAF